MAGLYWIITSLVLAIAVHAGYVLIAPSYALNRSIAAMVAEMGTNRFFIIQPKDQERLFPAYPPSHVFGACAFDVADSTIALSASMPDEMWTLTVYSASGDAIYTLNDSQSGTGRFTVSLALAPSLLEMISQTVGDDAVNTTGWDVQTWEPTGLAVFWIPVSETAMRASVIRVVSASTCRPALPPS